MKLMQLRCTLLFLFSSTLAVAQLKNVETIQYMNNFDDSSKNTSWMNSNTIILDSASGNYFSRTDAKNPYSAGIEIEIPQNLKQTNFRITIKCDIKIQPGAKNKFVIGISKNDSAIYWEGKQLGDSSLKANEWYSKNDSGGWNVLNTSVIIPRNIPADSKIKIYLWNEDGKSDADLDNLEITFTETPLTSFLPK